MDTFIGIDGIRGGWVAVYVDEEKPLRFDHSSISTGFLRFLIAVQ